MLNYTNTTKEVAQSGDDTVVISVERAEQFGPFLPMHFDIFHC